MLTVVSIEIQTRTPEGKYSSVLYKSHKYLFLSDSTCLQDTNSHNYQTFYLRKLCNLSHFLFFLYNLNQCDKYKRLVKDHLEFELNKLLGNNNEIPVNFVLYTIISNWDVANIIPVDHTWCYKIQKFPILRMEIEEALSWLSTLGGAFSSLGDKNIEFAKKAGLISMSQLKLSCIYGDPNLIVRCFIYLSHSLCQQNQRKKAIRLIKKCIYPFLIQMGDKIDHIVKKMYEALCFKVRFIYK